jgi:hypothetical protein
MRLFKYIAPILAVALVSSMWSCSSDDSSTLSEAVLASAKTLNFGGEKATPQSITVYADADWVTEVPEWVTVSPTSGTGVTDVTISVSDNMRGGALDNPRKANVIFKGRTLASQAPVLIMQAGDKFRDVQEYTPAQIAGLADETVVSVANVIVMAVVQGGFIATDEANGANIYVESAETVAVGDKISLILGSKDTDTYSLAYVVADQTTVSTNGNAVTYPTATDITGSLDTYTSTSRTYVEVSGVLTGTNVAVTGATYSVNVTAAASSVDLAALNGHKVTVRGYYAGTAAPVVRLMAVEIDDNGLTRTTYFFEDFEWLGPLATAIGAGQTVETDNMSATAPNIDTKGTVDGAETTAETLLTARGYSFLRVTQDSDNAGECIYVQSNYLKFGKTGYQAGMILPKITTVPADAEKLIMSFVWSPMRQGGGTIDPVTMLIIVKNGSDEVQFELPKTSRDYFASGEKLRWVKEEIDLTGVTIDENTQITIRETNWKLTTANRWFIDNIEIYEPDL